MFRNATVGAMVRQLNNQMRKYETVPVGRSHDEKPEYILEGFTDSELETIRHFVESFDFPIFS